MKAVSAVLAAAALTTGCASYKTVPLATSVTSTDPALSVLAAAIDRPFLRSQAVDLNAPLTPNALAVIAVLENPDLKALRSKAGVVDAQAFAARLLPDPTAQVGADKVLSGPDVFTALAGVVGFDLSMLRTRAAQRAKSAALTSQVRADVAWAEWQVACNARLQGARVSALSEQLPVAQMSTSATQKLYDQAARAAARGDIPQANVDAKRLAALDAATAQRALERDLSAARLELNRMLGLPPETRLTLGRAEPVLPVPQSAQLVDHALKRRLDLQALRKGYDAAEADARLAVILQFPNLSLNLTGARDTANNRTVGNQIAFTLPLWNRNRGGIAIANATRTQLHAEYDARLFQTRADIVAATSALDVLGRQRAELSAQLPALIQSTNSARRAAAHGDIPNVVADTTAQTLRDRQFAMLQLDQSAAEQMIALELLTGGPREVWPKAPANERKF